MDPIRLGIVGPGLIWENAHRPVLDAMVDRIVPVAFSATRDASRQKVARDYPHARYYSDYRELVAQPDLDAVLVMTPIALNYPVGMAALEAEATRLVTLGAKRLQRFEPEPPMSNGWLVMTDPEGNEFCLD